jgi:hypothetical protein
MIEVMVGLSLLVVMSSGIVALQKITTFGNMRARQLAIASRIGSTWLQRLRNDGSRWNYPSPSHPGTSNNLGETKWLSTVDSSPNVWFRPAEDATLGMSPGFDALGNDVPVADAAKAVYCTHVRLNWMYPPPTGNVPAPELIRADVRVFWLRESGPGPIGNLPVCSPDLAAADVDLLSNLAMTRYHFVYFSSSIPKNIAP